MTRFLKIKKYYKLYANSVKTMILKLVILTFLAVTAHNCVDSISLPCHSEANAPSSSSDSNEESCDSSPSDTSPNSASSQPGCPRENEWPQDLSTPFPYPTPSPINLNSWLARNSSVDTVLRHVIQANDFAFLNNTGHSITGHFGSHNSSTYVEGGFLENRYYYEGVSYFWSYFQNLPCSSLINGLGTPLQVAVFYLNEKYSSSQEAYKHRDGFFIFQIDVKVNGFVPNPRFQPFLSQLSKIRDPGCSINVTMNDLFQWFRTSSPNITNYFAYPGSYIDILHNNTQYDCATIVANPPDFQPSISIPQFHEAFHLLRNSYGISPYPNVLIPQSQGIRPVIIGDYYEVVFQQ